MIARRRWRMTMGFFYGKKDLASVVLWMECDPLFRSRLSIVQSYLELRAWARALELIWNTRKCRSELIFLWDKVIYQGIAQSVSLASLVISGPEMYLFQFGQRYCLCYFIWISLSSSSVPLSSFLLPTSSWEMWIPRRVAQKGKGWYMRGTEAFSSVRHFIP